MEQVRNARFAYRDTPLHFSEEKIHVKIRPDDRLQGQLYFGTEQHDRIRGYLHSTDRRFVPSVNAFSGTDIELTYGIDGKGMKTGEQCCGNLQLITNVGEYQIPFMIEACRDRIETSEGEIDNMDAFVELARNNFREAFHLFTSPDFAQVLEGEDERLQALYGAFHQNPVTYQHLEEFLISAGAKNPVKPVLRETEGSYYELREPVRESLEIVCDEWGYLRLEVEASDDFIQVQKQTITRDDFIGSVCHLDFLILNQKLGRGRTFGSIFLKGPYQTLEYKICASSSPRVTVRMGSFEKKKRAQLYRDFLQMKREEINLSTWAERAQDELHEMALAGCDYPIYQMYQAYVYHLIGQEEEAREILLKYQDQTFSRKDIELAGAYLYLCYETDLLTDRWDIAERLEQMYRQEKNSWLLLWLLMQIDEEYTGSPVHSVKAMEDQFIRGCRSPLLYLESFRLLQKDVNLLTRLSPFWIQVLLYGAKHHLMNEDFAMRIAYLSGYEKSFSSALYQLLALSYEQFPQMDVLEAICRVIMRDDVSKGDYSHWLLLAVDKDVRLTGLYEAFIESLDESWQEILPKPIRKYFVYTNTLSDNNKAFVYANVLRHREEDRDTCANYHLIIREFALRKLREGVIGEDYAVLYRALVDDIQTEEEAKLLGDMIFTNRLYCDDSKIRNVIVRHPQMKEEQVYPCVRGVAYPQIYVDDAVVLLQDYQQRRYETSIDYNLRPLFDDEAIDRCHETEEYSDGFLLWKCSDKNNGGKVTEDTLRAHHQLIVSDAFTTSYRRTIQKRLLDYYQAHPEAEDAQEYLANLDWKEFARVDKKTLLELLISRGLMSRAYQVYCEYGCEGTDSQALLKLCSWEITERQGKEEEELLSLAGKVFEDGLYDEQLLQYLMLYGVLSTDQMLLLFKSAVGLGLETEQLEEKVLSQLVFVNDYRSEGTDVLRSYVNHKGREEVVLSYLSFRAFGYFVQGERMEPYLETCLSEAYANGTELNIMCRLTLLKLYSENRSRTSEQDQQVRALLEDCAHEHLYFRFFEHFSDDLLAPYQLDDKVFVEYHGNPQARVTLQYALDTGLGQKQDYHSEPLRNCYAGYFVKTFTLFYGESLRFFFVIEQDGKQERTPVKIVTAKATHARNQNRYQMINQILADRRLGRDEEVIKGMQKYRQQENYVKQLFVPTAGEETRHE